MNRKHHQNRQQRGFCLPFAADLIDPPEPTCSDSKPLTSLRAGRSPCMAAPKQAANQAANQAASQSKNRMRAESPFSPNSRRVEVPLSPARPRWFNLTPAACYNAQNTATHPRGVENTRANPARSALSSAGCVAWGRLVHLKYVEGKSSER